MAIGCAAAGPSGTDTGAGGDSGADTASGPDSGDTAHDTADPSDTADTGGTPDDVAILTLNLHCFKLDGTGFADNDARFAAIAAAVVAEGVRAVAVQEACENEAEGKALDRLQAALATATGTAWGVAWTPTHTAWAGTADEAQEGVGLLVEGGDPTEVETLVYSVQGGLERRLLSGGFTTRGGAPLRLATVHLDFDDATARQAQARQSALHSLVHADAAWGTLLAGDFNATATDPAVQDVAAAGFTRLSAAADAGAEIDHVFAPAAAGFEVLSARLAFTGETEPVVSDHPGVVVHLRRHAPLGTQVIRLAATYDAGLGHFLAVRGGEAPLDWDAGWPAVNTASERWEAVFLGTGALTYKWLLDDATWESGDNRSADSGSTAEDAPGF